VLLFQVAMPSEVPGYMLGIARYQFLNYILILGMVELPFAIGAAGIVLTTWAIYTLQKRLSG
jgi:hypothetical protein